MQKVAVVKWQDRDEIGEAIASELTNLGYAPDIFRADMPLPSGVQIVFSFGPLGRFSHILGQVARQSVENRPALIHWNTEGMPDLKIPWRLMAPLADLRAWVGRLQESDRGWAKALAHNPPLSWLNRRMARFHYLGDYRFAHQKGWLTVLADSSAVYSQFRAAHKLPTVYAPWGSIPNWYADLKCERDIDVLWMGAPSTQRRRYLLDQIRRDLTRSGIRVYWADNEITPFIFGAERTRLLNRAKITLNITRTWYDDNYSRLIIAAANRSLVVSENLLPHCPPLQAGTHYIASPVNAIADTIRYFLDHAAEREQIVENAYYLLTTELTFTNTIQTIMRALNHARANSI